MPEKKKVINVRLVKGKSKRKTRAKPKEKARQKQKQRQTVNVQVSSGGSGGGVGRPLGGRASADISAKIRKGPLASGELFEH